VAYGAGFRISLKFKKTGTMNTLRTALKQDFEKGLHLYDQAGNRFVLQDKENGCNMWVAKGDRGCKLIDPGEAHFYNVVTPDGFNPKPTDKGFYMTRIKNYPCTILKVMKKIKVEFADGGQKWVPPQCLSVKPNQ